MNVDLSLSVAQIARDLEAAFSAPVRHKLSLGRHVPQIYPLQDDELHAVIPGFVAAKQAVAQLMEPASEEQRRQFALDVVASTSNGWNTAQTRDKIALMIEVLNGLPVVAFGRQSLLNVVRETEFTPQPGALYRLLRDYIGPMNRLKGDLGSLGLRIHFTSGGQEALKAAEAGAPKLAIVGGQDAARIGAN